MLQPASGHAESEQGPTELERHCEPPVMGQRILERCNGLVQMPFCREQEPLAPCGRGEGIRAVSPASLIRELVQPRPRRAELPHRAERLHEIAAEPEHARLAVTDLVGELRRTVQMRGRLRAVAEREGEEPERFHVADRECDVTRGSRDRIPLVPPLARCLDPPQIGVDERAEEERAGKHRAGLTSAQDCLFEPCCEPVRGGQIPLPALELAELEEHRRQQALLVTAQVFFLEPAEDAASAREVVAVLATDHAVEGGELERRKGRLIGRLGPFEQDVERIETSGQPETRLELVAG